MRISAIIFDCFGVLVEASLEPFCNKYLGNDTERLTQVKSLDDKACSGTITYEVYVEEMAKLAGISVDEATEFLDRNPANRELLNYIGTELRPRYKIGLLSNASDNWLEELFTPEELSLFNDTVLSFEHGIVKPDPAIFNLAAKRLGVQTGECVFVDDRLEYCNGATKAGMRAICYKSLDQLKNDLSVTLIGESGTNAT